ncbi:MAG: helix-turn-helix transcriptional regulator [Ginsengibacter sp.]
MIYHTIPPSEKLKEVVKSFWVLESKESYTHITMPDVCPELLFHYNGQFDELIDNNKSQKSFTAGVHAQTHQRRKFYVDSAFGMFGVCLYPYAIPLLFGISANELTNETPDLNSLLKEEGLRLEEEIGKAINSNQRVKIVEEFIVRKMAGTHQSNLPVFKAVQDIIETNGLITVKKLAGNYFLSERQFERKFLHYAGFSPKLFSRIVRFHAAMSQYGTREKSLTSIALECGYYDQSHFIHDFKEFSGLHPKYFFSGDSDATKWRE